MEHAERLVSLLTECQQMILGEFEWRLRDAIGATSRHCKSEIERTMGVALWMKLGQTIRESVHLHFSPESIDADHWLGQPPRSEIVDFICPQYPIGRFVADFAVRRIVTLDEGKPVLMPLVVVECDGHDFHERTKEQAAHDRNRDREMTLAGHRVMRFTGSEIWRDPDRCATQVREMLDQFYNEHFDAWVDANQGKQGADNA